MDESLPKVSIVLPTYSGVGFLAASIRSCLNQTHKNIELIIVDDGSKDNILEIVQSFKDDRIQLIRQPSNQGHIKALNKGFSIAIGDFLTWTSDDNYYALKAMETMLNVLVNNQNVDFVYANYAVVDENDIYIRQGRVEPPRGLDVDNCVGGCFLYRRKVYEKIGNFNEEAFLAEDYEYWLRVRKEFVMKDIPNVLYYYRFHERSLTGVHKEEKVQLQVEKIREKFIALWKTHYYRAQKKFNAGEISEAKKEILTSLKLNPYCCEVWRLFMVIVLSPGLVDEIRRCKKFFRK